MVFHVWVKRPRTQYYSTSQRLVTFVNREAADEFWRTVSAPDSVYAGGLERISPQLYVQSDKDVFTSFNDDHISPATRHFSQRMFITHGDHASNSIPNELTDHISGRWYFIRSRVDPSSYWYLRTSGTCVVCAGANCDAIHVSSEYRTRFCVRVRRNPPTVPENFVMIRKDEISITASRGYVVCIDDAGDLKAKKDYQGETDLLFGDLSNRFVTRAERQVNGEVWEYVESVERDVGEPWELV